MTRNRPTEHGMTLVVVAVVLVSLGALMILGSALQNMRYERQRMVTTSERLDRVTEAVIEFAMIHKRLPCPADGAEETGVETVTPEGCADQSRGTVPWRSLGLPTLVARDRWGRKLTYRVAEQAEMLVNIDTLDGVGLVVCADAACTSHVHDPARRTGAAFVLIGHGKDGRGGFISGSGERVKPAAPATTSDTLADADYFDDITRAMSFSDLLSKLRLEPISTGSDSESKGG